MYGKEHIANIALAIATGLPLACARPDAGNRTSSPITRIESTLVPMAEVQPTATLDQVAHVMAFNQFLNQLNSTQGKLDEKSTGLLGSGRNYIKTEITDAGKVSGRFFSGQDLITGRVSMDEQYVRVRWMTEDFALLTCAGSPCKNENWGSAMGESEIRDIRFTVSKPTNPTPADIRNGLIWKVKVSFSTRFRGYLKPLPISEADYPPNLDSYGSFSSWRNEDKEFTVPYREGDIQPSRPTSGVKLPLDIIAKSSGGLAQKLRGTNTSGRLYISDPFGR